MNRGVMVIRSNPSLEELQDSALLEHFINNFITILIGKFVLRKVLIKISLNL